MVCGNIFELRAHVFCVFPPFLVVFWHTLLAGAMPRFLGHHSTFHHSPVLHNPSAEPCTMFFSSVQRWALLLCPQAHS